MHPLRKQKQFFEKVEDPKPSRPNKRQAEPETGKPAKATRKGSKKPKDGKNDKRDALLMVDCIP